MRTHSLFLSLYLWLQRDCFVQFLSFYSFIRFSPFPNIFLSLIHSFHLSVSLSLIPHPHPLCIYTTVYPSSSILLVITSLTWHSLSQPPLPPPPSQTRLSFYFPLTFTILPPFFLSLYTEPLTLSLTLSLPDYSSVCLSLSLFLRTTSPNAIFTL